METLSGVLDALLSFDAALWAVLVVGVVAGLLVGVLPGLTFVMGVLLHPPADLRDGRRERGRADAGGLRRRDVRRCHHLDPAARPR